MGGLGYAQELSVNFIRVDGCAVVVNIRSFEKRLETSIESAEEIKGMGFIEGEKVRLFYTDKTTWEIRKINLDVIENKYFGRND